MEAAASRNVEMQDKELDPTYKSFKTNLSRQFSLLSYCISAPNYNYQEVSRNEIRPIPFPLVFGNHHTQNMALDY